ncbi:MAG: lamin tail domain-containing protein, partial [Verrucomicrobiales bacterium]
MKQTSLTILLLAFLSGHGLSQVVISEVVTNNTKLEDEDTDEPDWFELHNTGAADVDLEGWHLTTSDTAETVWTLPQLTLPAGT